MPFSRGVHVVTLLPTISPPFAIAIAAILLFGRNGLITRQILGIRPGPGVNDIYGLDGLIFVQIITFFPVAYLIIRAMLERIDASMEEAALSLGASKFHIFRTVTLPLLAPGIAASFLLLFVESLADLGNPLLIAGNATVLSVEIYLAVAGQFDQQKAASLSVILLIPTLTLFLLQRYYIGRRSYIAVTGKPTTGRIFVKEPVIRWTFIVLTLLTLALVLLLYFSILAGSFTKLWGIDNRLELDQLRRRLYARPQPAAVHHLPVGRGHAAGRADRHGHRLPGGAPRLCRQADARLCLQPRRRRARHDPGHRLHPGLYRGALVRRRADLCAAGGLSGLARATSNWVLQLVIVAGRRVCGLLLQLAALPAQRQRGWLALPAGGWATRCWR